MDLNTNRAYVSYLYWDSCFDEWVGDVTHRFAPIHTHTYREGGELKVGQRVEVLDEKLKWLEAFIIDSSPTQVKVHYKGYHPKFDEWIDRTCTHRFQPYGRNKIKQQPRNVLWSAQPSNSLASSRSILPSSTPGVGHSGSGSNSSVGENHNYAHTASVVRYIDEEQRRRKIDSLSAQYLHYKKALEEQHLAVVAVSGDGNCLFRAVAHQIYGDERHHAVVRAKCMDYMEAEVDFFSQFIEGGKEWFPFYVAAKRRDGCWGDDPEIEAICELYNRPAEIWAYDCNKGARKLRTFHESVPLAGVATATRSSSSSLAPAMSVCARGENRERSGPACMGNDLGPALASRIATNPLAPLSVPQPSSSSSSAAPSASGATTASSMAASSAMLAHAPPMRLSYYGGGHYDSIVDMHHRDHLLLFPPGEWEDHRIQLCKKRRALSARLEQSGTSSIALSANLRDVEATDALALEFAVQESRRLISNQERDDLETCLMLSLDQTSRSSGPGQSNIALDVTASGESSSAANSSGGTTRNGSLGNGFGWAKEESTATAPGVESVAGGLASSSAGLLPARTLTQSSRVSGEESRPKEMNEVDALATQGELLRTIQEESEREFLDQALLSSLQDDSIAVEEELVNHILQASGTGDFELRAEGRSAVEGVHAEEVLQEDKDLQLALQLSRNCEQEMLERAMQQSLLSSSVSSTMAHSASAGAATVSRGSQSSTQARNAFSGDGETGRFPADAMLQVYDDDEDADLNRAIAASLHSSAHPASSSSQYIPNQAERSAIPGGTFWQLGQQSADLEDQLFEDDLQRAIQESLRH